MQITCYINNRSVTQNIEPDLLLIDFIRALGYKSVKRGCDTTNCGCCTVWVDEKPVLSCAILAARINNQTITTLEGLEEQAKAVGHFLADQGAEQCGFCSPGLIMNILAMEKEYTHPTRDEIGHYLAGNLCRCSGYEGQIRAVTEYFKSKHLDSKSHDPNKLDPKKSDPNKLDLQTPDLQKSGPKKPGVQKSGQKEQGHDHEFCE